MLQCLAESWPRSGLLHCHNDFERCQSREVLQRSKSSIPELWILVTLELRKLFANHCLRRYIAVVEPLLRITRNVVNAGLRTVQDHFSNLTASGGQYGAVENQKGQRIEEYKGPATVQKGYGFGISSLCQTTSSRQARRNCAYIFRQVSSRGMKSLTFSS